MVDYFEANRAEIGYLHVKCKLSSPAKKADIAYHFDVNHAHLKELNEGDIVGLKTKANGETAIIELSSTNVHNIMQAGVISRSAFLEGNIPKEKGTFFREVFELFYWWLQNVCGVM